jgi:hypothetical protein
MNNRKSLRPAVPDLEAWRSANTLVDRYGAQAWLISARQADAFLSQGDMKGRRAWMAVHQAIAELLRTSMTAGEHRH